MQLFVSHELNGSFMDLVSPSSIFVSALESNANG